MIFRIDLKIFIFLILYYFTRQIEIYSIAMIFAIIHEMGHLISGILLGMKIEKISLLPVGISVQFKLDSTDYNKKVLNSNKLEIKRLIVATSGPAINFIIIVLISIFLENSNLQNTIIYSNLLIALFNLIPIYPLDGGRILKSIFCILLGRKKANIYINIISNLTMFVISLIFSILVYYCKNIAFLIILVYLWYIVKNENRIFKIRLLANLKS